MVWTSPSCCSHKCLEEAGAVLSEAAAIHLVAAPVLQGDRDIRTVIRMGSGFELDAVLCWLYRAVLSFVASLITRHSVLSFRCISFTLTYAGGVAGALISHAW